MKILNNNNFNKIIQNKIMKKNASSTNYNNINNAKNTKII